MASKPRVLVLGGLGFIGKHLVDFLVKNDYASKVRVVDKTMVEMARLSKAEEELFSKVECIQANLCNPDSTAKAFTDGSGEYDIVINLAAMTRLSQSDEVYNQDITNLSTTVAKEAAKHKVQKYIEVSTAEVYKPSSKPTVESGEQKPFTGIGKAKAKAEEQVKAIGGLPLIIVRPALVYGPGDTKGLGPRIAIAAVYKKTGEKLEYPTWFEEQKMSTVHVSDVVRALWHLAQNGAPGSVYNLADKNDTDQKKLNAIFEKVFGIKTGHMGAIKSEAAKALSTETLLSEINGEHGNVWVKLLGEHKLDYSPLNPYIDAEFLGNNDNSVDGSAIEKTGFSYEYPSVSEDAVRAQIKYYVDEKWMPAL